MPGWGITRWAADRGNKKPGDLKQSVDLKATLGNERRRHPDTGRNNLGVVKQKTCPGKTD